MGCRIIALDVERWACVHDEDRFQTYVSSKGRVKIAANGTSTTLSMKQAMNLSISLAMACGDEAEEEE